MGSRGNVLSTGLVAASGIGGVEGKTGVGVGLPRVAQRSCGGCKELPGSGEAVAEGAGCAAGAGPRGSVSRAEYGFRHRAFPCGGTPGIPLGSAGIRTTSGRVFVSGTADPDEVAASQAGGPPTPLRSCHAAGLRARAGTLRTDRRLFESGCEPRTCGARFSCRWAAERRKYSARYRQWR
jgi:hypothetical protein